MSLEWIPSWVTWERVTWVVILILGQGLVGTVIQRDIAKERLA